MSFNTPLFPFLCRFSCTNIKHRKAKFCMLCCRRYFPLPSSNAGRKKVLYLLYAILYTKQEKRNILFLHSIGVCPSCHSTTIPLIKKKNLCTIRITTYKDTKAKYSSIYLSEVFIVLTRKFI